MQEDGAEKSHEPSQRKLDEARKKGELPRSTDLTTAASYGGLLIALALFAGPAIERAGALMAGLLHAGALSAADPPGGPFRPHLGGVMQDTVMALSPLLLLPAGAAVAALVAQRAVVFAPSKLAPKLSRISPLSIAKQKFGLQGLFEFAKSFAKLALYTALLTLFLADRLPAMIGVIRAAPQPAAALMGRMAIDLVALAVIIAAVLGGIDLLWQRMEHMRKNRMTHRELRDEAKETEGDPHLKQARRQRAQTIATTRMMADVPDANVVIVNPTHYAVALAWDPERDGAPRCVAKGRDEIAQRIRDIARDHGVPVQSDPPTARALFALVEIGQQIPPDHYRAVAAAIRFAEEMRRRARQRGRR